MIISLLLLSSCIPSEEVFIEPEAERPVSILEQSKERLRARGIDCSFENEHTTKNSLAIDPQDPDIIYMSGTQGYVWKSEEGGKRWKTVLSLEMLSE